MSATTLKRLATWRRHALRLLVLAPHHGGWAIGRQSYASVPRDGPLPRGSRREIAAASTRVVAAATIVVGVLSISNAGFGSHTTSQTQALAALADALSQKPQHTRYTVALDGAARRLAERVLHAEYVVRRCGPVDAAFLPGQQGETCEFAVGNARAYDDHLVRGSLNVVRDCPSARPDDLGDPVTANECFAFTVVGRTTALNEPPALTYPLDRQRLIVVRRNGRWRVAWENPVLTSSGGGERLWPRRVRS